MLPKPSDLLSVEQDSSSHFPNRVLVGFTSMVRKGTLMFWMKHTVLMAEAMEYDKILQRQLIGKWMNVFPPTSTGGLVGSVGPSSPSFPSVLNRSEKVRNIILIAELN